MDPQVVAERPRDPRRPNDERLPILIDRLVDGREVRGAAITQTRGSAWVRMSRSNCPPPTSTGCPGCNRNGPETSGGQVSCPEAGRSQASVGHCSVATPTTPPSGPALPSPATVAARGRQR